MKESTAASGHDFETEKEEYMKVYGSDATVAVSPRWACDTTRVGHMVSSHPVVDNAKQ